MRSRIFVALMMAGAAAVFADDLREEVPPGTRVSWSSATRAATAPAPRRSRASGRTWPTVVHLWWSRSPGVTGTCS
jgi:hypothetical protein